MSHPIPDPCPPSTALARINAVRVAIFNAPERYSTTTLVAIRTAALELARAIDRVVSSR